MLISITYRQLKNVTFPVYPIQKEEELVFRDGLLMTSTGLIIDDKNQPGDTLGKRRLTTPHKLRKLSRGYTDIASMIRSNKLTWIDSLGKPFKYRKTKFVSVLCKKIKKIEKRDTYSLLWVVGVDVPFRIHRPPPPGIGWAKLIYVDGFPFQLYEYSEEHVPPRKKKL